MKNVFLIGYMGVGKTTIGKKLARILGFEFIDLDRFIEIEKGTSITEIMQQFGESFFRELERDYLLELSKKNNVLISTGGGTPCFFDNINLINETGTSIYLKMDEKSLVNRLKNNLDSRPLLKGKNEIELAHFVNQHLAKRLPFYKMAKIEFDVLSFNSARLAELKNEIELI